MSSESHTRSDVPHAGSIRTVAPYTNTTELLGSAQDVLGRKWHPIVVYVLLSDGPMRFSELKRRVDGISSKMLSESLDTLEEADVVDRTVLDSKPVRVEYALTTRGDALEPVIVSMIQWSRGGDGAETVLADRHHPSRR